MNRKFSKLNHFFGCYFNQDWEEEFNGDPVRAVSAFIGDESPDDVEATLAQLEFLLNHNYSEEKLEDILYRDLDCAYYPPGGGETYKGWLTKIHDQIAKHIGRTTYAQRRTPSPPTHQQPRLTAPPAATRGRPSPGLNTDHLFTDLLTRPLLLGVLCWFVLGASSCFKISWVRLKDFNYRNDFFSESIHNDGWYYGFLIGVVAGLLWGVLTITRNTSYGRLVALTTIAVLGFVLVKLPISGRWGNTSYESSEAGISAIKNAHATAVRFYQVSNYDVDTPAEKRGYGTRFKQAKQRTYIKYQVELQNQAPGQRVNFKYDVLLRRYDSKQWTEVGWSHPDGYVDASWTSFNFVGGWGLVNKGKYEADFYIDGKGIAMGTFEIY